MRSLTAISQFLAASLILCLASAKPLIDIEARWGKKCIKPKVFIIDMFPPEGDVWYGIPEFNLLAKNITVPGASPLYPDVHCTANEEVCQIVTGESGRLVPLVLLRHWLTFLQKLMLPVASLPSPSLAFSTSRQHTSL
jgi:purine nucleoside permease